MLLIYWNFSYFIEIFLPLSYRIKINQTSNSPYSAYPHLTETCTKHVIIWDKLGDTTREKKWIHFNHIPVLLYKSQSTRYISYIKCFNIGLKNLKKKIVLSISQWRKLQADTSPQHLPPPEGFMRRWNCRSKGQICPQICFLNWDDFQ